MPTKKRRPTRLSESVVRAQRPAVDIEKSASSNAQPVAADLEPFLLRGLPEGQTLPDMALFQVMLGAIVRHDSEAMEAADEAHFEALSRLNHFQLVRDDYKNRLYPKLTDIRDTWDAAFGQDTCQRILGLGVALPAETLRVRRLVDRIVRLLSAPDFQLPPLVSDIAGVDTQKWVDQLKPDLEGLRATWEQLFAAKREAERTLAAKTASVATYRTSYSRCTQLLETFYRVSGNEHLAEKLRPPKPRSKASTPETDATEPEAAEASPAAEGDGGEERQAPGADEPATRGRPDRPPADPEARWTPRVMFDEPARPAGAEPAEEGPAGSPPAGTEGQPET